MYVCLNIYVSKRMIMYVFANGFRQASANTHIKVSQNSSVCIFTSKIQGCQKVLSSNTDPMEFFSFWNLFLLRVFSPALSARTYSVTNLHYLV